MAYENYQVHPQLTALAIAYKSAGTSRRIADIVSPIVPVPSDPFLWTQFNTADAYRLEDDAVVGRTGRPNTIDVSSQLVTASCSDYGLIMDLPNRDRNQPYPVSLDPQANATQQILEKMLDNRERRVATLFTTLGNYDSDKRQTLSGTSQFSDTTNSDPIGVISTALDAPLVRPNTMIVPRAVFTVLRRHPKIVNAVTGAAGVQAGFVSEQQIADLFGVNQVLVPDTFVNTANKGQSSNYSRLWGKDIVMLYQSPTASIVGGGVTFSLTGQFGDRAVRTWDNPAMGIFGGTSVLVGWSLAELIVGKSAGYLIKDAVA